MSFDPWLANGHTQAWLHTTVTFLVTRISRNVTRARCVRDSFLRIGNDPRVPLVKCFLIARGQVEHTGEALYLRSDLKQTHNRGLLTGEAYTTSSAMSSSAVVDRRVLDALTKGSKIGVVAVEKMRILSSGNYSKVYLNSGAEGNNRIFKVLSKKSTQLHALHRIRTEIVIHRLVNEHPNIIRLLDVEESEDKVILELEYAPKGDLFDLVVRSGGSALV